MSETPNATELPGEETGEAIKDFEKALLFLYIQSEKITLEQQTKLLARLCGWSVNRAQSAFEVAAIHGYADIG